MEGNVFKYVLREKQAEVFKILLTYRADKENIKLNADLK